MTETLISLETAKLAKEKGFDWPCKKRCDIDITMSDPFAPMPTQSLLQKWLRDKRIHIQVVYERGVWCYILEQLPSDEDITFAASGECEDGDLWLLSSKINTDWFLQEYTSYEEALEAGLLESLKLV